MFQCLLSDVIDVADRGYHKTNRQQFQPRTTDELLVPFSHNRITTVQATPKAQSRVACLTTSQRREVPCRHPTCQIVLESQTAFPTVKSQLASKSPSANQSATATIGTLHREIREMKPFRLCSPIWLIIRPTGLEPGPMLSGRLFVTCKTVSFRSERHRWSRRSQNTKTRFSSARASWEWRISAFVWALKRVCAYRCLFGQMLARCCARSIVGE